MRISVIAGFCGLIVYGASFLDARYASASEISKLITSVTEGRIERLEYEIKMAERRIQRVQLTPEEQRTPWDLQDLQDALNEKEFLLRQLERLQDDD